MFVYLFIYLFILPGTDDAQEWDRDKKCEKVYFPITLHF